MPPFYAEARTQVKHPDRRNEQLALDFIAIAAKMDQLCPHKPSDAHIHEYESPSATYPNPGSEGVSTKAWIVRKDFGRDVDQKPSYVMFRLRVQAYKEVQPVGDAYDIFTTDTWGTHKIGIDLTVLSETERQQFIANTNDTLDRIANAVESLEDNS
jgi:hypothetical protein